MQYRGRMLLAIAVLGGWLTVGGTTSEAARPPEPVSEIALWKMIIHDSIAAYPRSCPCPYSADRLGQRCGNNSAYHRSPSTAPVCYPQDITDEQLARYREAQQ
jgi:hypothetical protein